MHFLHSTVFWGFQRLLPNWFREFIHFDEYWWIHYFPPLYKEEPALAERPSLWFSILIIRIRKRYAKRIGFLNCLIKWFKVEKKFSIPDIDGVQFLPVEYDGNLEGGYQWVTMKEEESNLIHYSCLYYSWLSLLTKFTDWWNKIRLFKNTGAMLIDYMLNNHQCCCNKCSDQH